MPRIEAASIEEHLQARRARITQEAAKLFRERGLRRTELADIAAAAGLARNSLYRYFPSKDHILVACIQEEMRPYLERLETLAERYPDPHARVQEWLRMQFELAVSSAHATMELMADVRAASDELAKNVLHLHEAPNKVLESALNQLFENQQIARIQAAMIGGMVLAATGEALKQGKEKHSAIRQLLESNVRCLLENAQI